MDLNLENSKAVSVSYPWKQNSMAFFSDFSLYSFESQRFREKKTENPFLNPDLGKISYCEREQNIFTKNHSATKIWVNYEERKGLVEWTLL